MATAKPTDDFFDDCDNLTCHGPCSGPQCVQSRSVYLEKTNLFFWFDYRIYDYSLSDGAFWLQSGFLQMVGVNPFGADDRINTYSYRNPGQIPSTDRSDNSFVRSNLPDSTFRPGHGDTIITTYSNNVDWIALNQALHDDLLAIFNNRLIGLVWGNVNTNGYNDTPLDLVFDGIINPSAYLGFDGAVVQGPFSTIEGGGFDNHVFTIPASFMLYGLLSLNAMQSQVKAVGPYVFATYYIMSDGSFIYEKCQQGDQPGDGVTPITIPLPELNGIPNFLYETNRWPVGRITKFINYCNDCGQFEALNPG